MQYEIFERILSYYTLRRMELWLYDWYENLDLECAVFSKIV